MVKNMPISGSAALAGVIGWPVAHSRSPRLHNFWLQRHGIDGAYLPLPVAPGDFATAVHGLRAAGFRGVNVTIPHKEAAFALCDATDDAARACGAVNTLVFSRDQITGSNTDGAGFIANLRSHGVNAAAGPILLLGAGGAARAIAAALLALGAPVHIANRSPDRADALVAALPGLLTIPWASSGAALADYAMLVNTTSLGMRGQAPLDIDLAGASSNMAVADIVYVPLQTPLLANARARGLRTVGGLGMLLHQAVPGFAQWFGVTPSVDQEAYDLLAADIPPA
jgi:shikimate dehydrogenase